MTTQTEVTNEVAVAPVAPKAKRVRKPKIVAPPVVEVENEDEVNDILASVDERPLAEVVKEVKRRKASNRERGEDQKVIRKGRNLSGNQPFRVKPYYYDLDVKETPDYEKAFSAAPMQVRLILKYMEEQGITTEDDAEIGAEIAGGAINSGKLQSKIDPAALFAYYRRVMERLGLRLAIAE